MTKKLMIENTSYVNTGNQIFYIPERNKWHSFTRPVKDIDKYPRSKEMIGKLLPELQSMKT